MQTQCLIQLNAVIIQHCLVGVFLQTNIESHHEIYETCPSVTFYFMKISFSDIDRKWILPNMIRAVTEGQVSWNS